MLVLVVVVKLLVKSCFEVLPVKSCWLAAVRVRLSFVLGGLLPSVGSGGEGLVESSEEI